MSDRESTITENDQLFSPHVSSSYGSGLNDHASGNGEFRGHDGSAFDDALTWDEADQQHGEAFDSVPQAKRQLGLFSVVFLTFNRMIGTGIYATPSNILRSSGSVGVSLLMWLIGALIASCGASVYVELGTGLPRSGGEKNYLEYIYRRPRFLITCMFAFYIMLMSSGPANSIVFSEYVLHSLSITPSRLNTRLIAFFCLTFICLIHGTHLKWGLRLQNTLGLFKLFLLCSVALSGLLCLFGVPGFQVREGYDMPNNFASWENFWEGSGTGVNAFVAGIYNVIWSFTGFSGANYALSEVRDPVRTIKRSTPLAMLFVISVYMFTNIGYYAAVSKTDILGSRQIIAALFFRNLFGPAAEKMLSIFIALSALGNLLASQFGTGRVIQELGREGVLPYSSFFASNKPFNAPLSGLFTQYVFSCALIFAIPDGDAYLFLISMASYTLTLVNTLVSLGLLLLYTSAYREWGWNPPYQAPKFIIMLFFLSNVFLAIVPFIPPASGTGTYAHLPYWSHSVGSFAVSLVGLGYWYVWGVWLPKRKGYKLEREWILQDDGVSRYAFRKVPLR